MLAEHYTGFQTSASASSVAASPSNGGGSSGSEGDSSSSSSALASGVTPALRRLTTRMSRHLMSALRLLVCLRWALYHADERTCAAASARHRELAAVDGMLDSLLHAIGRDALHERYSLRPLHAALLSLRRFLLSYLLPAHMRALSQSSSSSSSDAASLQQMLSGRSNSQQQVWMATWALRLPRAVLALEESATVSESSTDGVQEIDYLMQQDDDPHADEEDAASANGAGQGAAGDEDSDEDEDEVEVEETTATADGQQQQTEAPKTGARTTARVVLGSGKISIIFHHAPRFTILMILAS